VSYLIKISKTAKAETRQIFEYLTDYSPDVADKHLVRLTNSIALIGRPLPLPILLSPDRPIARSFFSVARSSFWVVYEVDAPKRTVDILRIWNSKQNPEDFEF